jgi:spermidine synthase
MIRAAGLYYQNIHDLSLAGQAAHPERQKLAHYYELPYKLAPRLDNVAVVGAGTGNDVAAGLRSGARSVDAIEIDPAILALGLAYHPEAPYQDERVHRVVNDARTFMRTTARSYDLIVYGLLDSHTLLSQASSVRLDSFVYTVEGLRDARARLTADGIVSLSFCVLSEGNGRKIYLMMEQAFDGHPPIVIRTEYDGSVIFAQARNGGLRVDPELIERSGFHDLTALYANPRIAADVSTDDWPFFYMPRRVYPVSYLWMGALVLLVSLGLFSNFFSGGLKLGYSSFFFLGAGFMLVETKGITEMGLTFGNTWQVIGVVIAAVLVMAWLANVVVSRTGLRSVLVPYALLLASLGAGLLIMGSGGFPSTPTGQIGTAMVLTCPLFFSGMVFSVLLRSVADVSSAMAMNLLGAMFGGLLEYNAMYFGFLFLYWVAVALYVAAMGSSIVGGFGPIVARGSMNRS